MNWLRVFRHGMLLGFRDFEIFWSSWRVWVATHILRVVTTAITWTLMGRLLASDDQVFYLLVGQIVLVGPQYVGWTVAAFTWDRMFIGTYPMLVASPTSLVPAFMGRTSVWVLNGFVTSLSTLLILAPVFRMPLSLSSVLWIPVLIGVVCVSYYGLCFCLGSLVNWVPRLRNIVHNTATLVIMTLCGVVVPITFWPDWVEFVVKILPVTHGLGAIRLLLAGSPAAPVIYGAALEAAVGLVWFMVGVLTLDRTVDVARRRGTIDLI